MSTDAHPEGSRLEPHFFSSHDRPLYGMFCPPARPRPGAPVVVACHSAGPEHAVASRILAQGVRRAAALGFPAMLFHARGHGDSGGDLADVTVASLVEDALAAAARGQELSGADRVIWLGLRFGGIVATAAAAVTPATAAIALWEPIHKGADYFREFIRGMLFSAVAQGIRSPRTVDELLAEVEREGRVDILASYIHRKFYQSARDCTLAQGLEHWRGPLFLAQIQPRRGLTPLNAALVKTLEEAGAEVTVTRVTEEPGWHFPLWRQPWTSAELLDATGAWLDALA